jgi:hypothetical protein
MVPVCIRPMHGTGDVLRARSARPSRSGGSSTRSAGTLAGAGGGSMSSSRIANGARGRIPTGGPTVTSCPECRAQDAARRARGGHSGGWCGPCRRRYQLAHPLHRRRCRSSRRMFRPRTLKQSGCRSHRGRPTWRYPTMRPSERCQVPFRPAIPRSGYCSRPCRARDQRRARTGEGSRGIGRPAALGDSLARDGSTC